MNNPLARLALVVSLTATVGCAATVWYGNKSTTLRMGMTKRQAQELLGSPKDILQDQVEGVVVETWKYLDRTLTFHNGVLQSWSSQP